MAITTGTQTLTAEQVAALSTSSWTHPGTGEIRLYLDGWEALAGLEVERYKSGNIRWAQLDGQALSNTKASRVAGARVWIDAAGRINSGLDAEWIARIEAGIARLSH